MPVPAALGTLAVLLAIGGALFRPALGLAVLAFSYPFDLTTHAGSLKLTTSAALLAILFVVWVVRQFLRNPPKCRTTTLDWPIVLFAGATVLSLVSVLGPVGDIDDELIGLLKAAGGFLIFFLTVQSLDERRDLWLVMGAIMATGLIQAIMTIFSVLTGPPLSAATRATGTTIQPNLFAGYLVLIIPLVFAAAAVLGQRWVAVAAGAILLYGVALIATLSRSGFMGLVAGTVALAILLPEKCKKIAVLGASVFVALFITGLAGPLADRLGEAAGHLTSLAGRLPIWDAAVQMLIQHPAFGVGVANFDNALGWYNPALHFDHAHNLFLNIAAERGIIGLATFSIVLVALFRTLAKGFNQGASPVHRAVSAGLAASFVAFFAHSMFDVSYYDYKILLLFWLLMGIAASLPFLFNERTSPLAPSPRSALSTNVPMA